MSVRLQVITHPPAEKFMADGLSKFECGNCGRALFYGILKGEYTISKRCSRCKHTTVLTAKREPSYQHSAFAAE